MATDSEPIKKESANPTKKIIMIAVPVVVLLLVIAVVLSLTLGSSVTDEVKPETWKVKKAASSPEQEEEISADPEASADSTEPPINADYEVYETRDPFKPATSTGPVSTKLPPQADSGTPTTATVTASEKPTLHLTGTTDENGVLFANVQYGTSTYAVSSGERVGESPFRVTSVTQDSVSFLYGDDTLTLQVGEEVVK